MTGHVLVALVPVVLLIGLGAVLGRGGFLDPPFWPAAERLVFYVLLPSLFFHGLATARLDDLPIAALAATLVLPTAGIAAALVALRPLVPLDGPAFTSLFQGSVRFNNYVGVLLAAGLFGTKGVALAALCNAALVPTVNVLCVLVFARYGSARPTAAGVVRQVATNPLVLASAAGGAFRLTGLDLPGAIEPALRVLGGASLPLGLLCVGAALDFRAARRWIVPVAACSAVKFVAMPAATLLAATLLGLAGPAMTVALLFQTLPTASSSYIMARQLGGDAGLMAGITALQTVIAMLALPAVLILAAPPPG